MDAGEECSALALEEALTLTLDTGGVLADAEAEAEIEAEFACADADAEADADNEPDCACADGETDDEADDDVVIVGDSWGEADADADADVEKLATAALGDALALALALGVKLGSHTHTHGGHDGAAWPPDEWRPEHAGGSSCVGGTPVARSSQHAPAVAAAMRYMLATVRRNRISGGDGPPAACYLPAR
jgi:hypothetical protein